jgi:hypothetical protein
MLYPVRGYPALCAAHTYKWALCDIIIQTIYIGIGVMDNVMLELPDKNYCLLMHLKKDQGVY